MLDKSTITNMTIQAKQQIQNNWKVIQSQYRKLIQFLEYLHKSDSKLTSIKSQLQLPKSYRSITQQQYDLTQLYSQYEEHYEQYQEIFRKVISILDENQYLYRRTEEYLQLLLAEGEGELCEWYYKQIINLQPINSYLRQMFENNQRIQDFNLFIAIIKYGGQIKAHPQQ